MFLLGLLLLRFIQTVLAKCTYCLQIDYESHWGLICVSITKIFLLLGLRVSQFNGDKCSAAPDPTQKTITNFITSGDVNRNCSSFPDVADLDFVSDAETNLSIDNRQTSQLDWRDPFVGNYLSDGDHQSCIVQKNGVEEVSLFLPTCLAM